MCQKGKMKYDDLRPPSVQGGGKTIKQGGWGGMQGMLSGKAAITMCLKVC